jgi:death-on-curing family protein
LNEKRILEQQTKEILKLQDTISIIYNKIKTPLLIGQEQELIGIIQRYTKSLSILRQYDRGLLKNIANVKSKFILEYNNCLTIINKLEKELEKRKELTELFGRQNHDEKLRGIIGALYQTFDKKELYSTVEEKAAHLLYLIIKDHPFIDGNKRIASILFVYFLNENHFLFNKNNELKIPDSMLATLALLVAISDSNEKDVIINLIINLIKT